MTAHPTVVRVRVRVRVGVRVRAWGWGQGLGLGLGGRVAHRRIRQQVQVDDAQRVQVHAARRAVHDGRVGALDRVRVSSIGLGGRVGALDRVRVSSIG